MPWLNSLTDSISSIFFMFFLIGSICKKVHERYQDYKDSLHRKHWRHIGMNKLFRTHLMEFIFRVQLLHFFVFIKGTACPREIVPRGGHPFGLIEYIIERVYQVFLSFELHKFGIFWNLHQPKGVPTPHFSST